VADKHPYSTSGPGGLVQVVTHLRKSFPATVTADTLKKLEIAPKNESYVLNILKFIGVLDAENKKVPAAAAVFNKHDHGEFQIGFGELVEKTYHELFSLHGANAWSLDRNKLISFFRNHDGTSDLVGKLQATTFQALAKIAGKITDDAPLAAAKTAKPAKTTIISNNKKASVAKVAPASTATSPAPTAHSQAHAPMQFNAPSKDGGVALTVRVEINLPAGGDQSTYDAIFKSIRQNLMNGNGA
jgi:Family of unknown function (DUF5343)